jgi:hypothetical protein
LLHGGCIGPVELKLGFLWGCEELASVVVLAFWGAYTQGKSEELVGSASFCVLLVKQVEEEILISLNKSLRVHLPMLQLLIAVSLDPFQ